MAQVFKCFQKSLGRYLHVEGKRAWDYLERHENTVTGTDVLQRKKNNYDGISWSDEFSYTLSQVKGCKLTYVQYHSRKMIEGRSHMAHFHLECLLFLPYTLQCTFHSTLSASLHSPSSSFIMYLTYLSDCLLTEKIFGCLVTSLDVAQRNSGSTNSLHHLGYHGRLG